MSLMAYELAWQGTVWEGAATEEGPAGFAASPGAWAEAGKRLWGQASRSRGRSLCHPPLHAELEQRVGSEATGLGTAVLGALPHPFTAE